MSVENEPGELDDWHKAKHAEGAAQARALREQAQQGGLSFEAYLPPRLAEWLLDRIERGTFYDPSEATFVLLGESRDLEPHADLRREVLARIFRASIDDPRPSLPMEEVFDELRKKSLKPLPTPAVWKKS